MTNPLYIHRKQLDVVVVLNNIGKTCLKSVTNLGQPPKRIMQNKMRFHTEDFMEPRGIELLIQGDTVRYKNLFIFSAL